MGKRITKSFKPQNTWVRQLVNADPEIGTNLDYTNETLRLQARDNLCSICKGSKMLCGMTRCPIVQQAISHTKMWRNIKGLNIDGSSPPSVFVGRFGYPYVQIGPMTPTSYGDTSLLDDTERWFGRSMDEIIDFRSQLVRGMTTVNVNRIDKAGKIFEATRELSLAEHYVETELKLNKPPLKRLYIDNDIQPIGPTAPLNEIEIGFIKWEHNMEKAHYDSDLKAAEAAKTLYKNGVNVNSIMRAFSMGSFGIEKNRRLVPTRWSITAIDDLLSKDMANRIKDYPFINNYQVYESEYLGNRFEVLLIPDAWSYEAYEAWYPKTLWNPSESNINIVTDWEGYSGRCHYASMGGCYYSGRLAVLEFLTKIRRQAKVFIFREAYPDYIIPVGVWQVRENVRNAMRQKPKRFENINDALKQVMNRLSIPLEKWIESGPLLKHTLTQRKITEYT
ncbi:hypothetical protein JW865_07130 [Candidatus Bathyarchaeota archaeon]|nr:hypothetical protein [Candidatus Bathyarchaeota archaeon]